MNDMAAKLAPIKQQLELQEMVDAIAARGYGEISLATSQRGVVASATKTIDLKPFVAMSLRDTGTEAIAALYRSICL